jgi:FtsZ-binding cell division protein ZapB
MSEISALREEVKRLREENVRLYKVIDEKIDSIGDLVKENERLKRNQLALGSETPDAE